MLFPLFARYVQRKISLGGNPYEHASTSFRTVFERIVSSFPVSSRAIQRATELNELSLDRHGLDTCRWFCMVAQESVVEQLDCVVEEERGVGDALLRNFAYEMLGRHLLADGD